MDAGNRSGFLQFVIEEDLKMKKLLATIPAWSFVLALAAAWPNGANAATFSYGCTVSEVGVFANRIHVRCTKPAPGPFGDIWFFAVSTANSTTAARFLTMFNSALVENRRLTLQYDAFDSSGEQFGCRAVDCRGVDGAILGPRQ